MAYYLVKAAQTSKDGSKTLSWYYGKDGKLLKSEGHTGDDAWMDFDWINDYTLSEYGYKRLCDAKRAYCYTHEHDTETWKVSVDIVTFGIFTE